MNGNCLKLSLIAITLAISASTAAAESLYTINLAARTLMRINSETAAVTTVGPIGFQFFGADLTYFDGSIYAITAHADGFFANAGYSLLKINPQTGALQNSVEILLNGNKPFFMESIGVANGKLYVGFSPGGTVSTDVGEINPVTGAITGNVNYQAIPGVGNLYGSFGVDLDGMSDHPTQSGSLLTMDTDAGLISLVRIDPVNVTASSEGQFFYTGGGLDDLAVGLNGVYAIGDGRLHVFNAGLDGVVEFTNFDPLGQFAGLTVPEPSSVVLAALGIVGMFVLGRRRLRFVHAAQPLCLLVMCACLAGQTSRAHAVFLAQTGFNDNLGINSNAVPGSPYVLGGAMAGAGAGEPGWAEAWQGGSHIVQSSVVFEGDGAAQLNPNSQTFRSLTDQLQIYRADQYVRMTAGASMTAYTMQLPGNEINQGPIWQIHSDGTFWVIDGEEDGAIVAPAEFSGFSWSPGDWYKITVKADLIDRSWNFFVNDVQYISPDPLGFRGNPTHIERISYFTGSTGLVYLDGVTIVPEPSSVVLGALGLLAVFGCQRFSRRGVSLALFAALGLFAAQTASAGVVTSKTILDLPVNALKMDPVREILYAAVPSSGGVGVGNSITRIDLLTRTIMDSTFIGSEPQAITVSSDGSQMYVDISGAFKIRALDLNTMTPGPQSTVPENYIVADLAAVPTRPDTFVASLLRAGSPQYVGLQVWQFDGTTFTHDPIVGIAAYNLAYSPDPSTFYATSGQTLAKVTLGPGDSLSAQYGGMLGGPDPGIALDGDLLVSTQARAFDLTDFTAAGLFSGGEFSGGVAVDTEANKVYLLRGQTIRIFDMTTFIQIDSLTIPEVGNAGSYTLLRFGANGLAFNTDQGQVFLIKSPAIGVPEPSSVVLAAMAVGGLVVSTLSRRRKLSA